MTFRNPIVAGEELQIPGVRSQDYIEAENGWRIGRNGAAQFTDARFLGDIGTDGQVSADTFAGETFTLGQGGLWTPKGEELSELLERNRWDPDPDGPHPNGPQGPKGCVAYYADTAVPGTFTGTETGLIATRFHEEPNRLYMFIANIRLNQSVATDAWYLPFRYTRDNTIPVVASTRLRDFVLPSAAVAGASAPRTCAFFHGSTQDSTMWVGMFLARYVGTGTATLVTNASNYCDLAIFDMGPRPGAGEGTNAMRGGQNDPWLYGSSYATPAVVTPTTTAKTYTTTYNPTWSRTFDGDGTTTYDDSAYCYQGEYTPTPSRGNTKSLVGYDAAKIMADLTGATVNSVKLTFKVAHSYYGTGLTAIIGAHNYTTKPGSVSMANIAENQTSRAKSVAGSTYTVTLPASFGTNLKSGTWKGIAFGPAPALQLGYYGYMYGATQTGKPYLTISYTK